ncbi:hypothetical protein VNO77_43265 [Canavalia gladiata]|uniref:Uncharacterized protein n=1 Tax=Canavalia gladiata TaxID=3824 RepID=A0AAN9PMR8_CANGL
MGMNVKDIRLFRVVHDTTKSSYTFLKRHPFASGALIFWSSEQTQLRYVKREEQKGEQKKVEPKLPKIPNNGRHELLYKYPSQNATSRRRNFTDKKWDVYGGLEEKAKDLSAVFHNEFAKRNIENKEARSIQKGESSLGYGLSSRKNQVPRRQTLRSEPSMIDLVECGDIETEAEKDGDEEDEEEAREERNKAIEWTEDDQKNLMNLGISEIERNKRLENLIARRKARKLIKSQLENSAKDKKPIAALLTTRANPFDSSQDFEDGLEIPGSAPSFMPRSPYDIPYDSSEEKPNLTRDNILQEISHHQKDMSFCRHESFSLGHIVPSEIKQDHGTGPHYSFNNGRKYSDRLPYSRFRRPSDKGNHDWLIDQLIYNESGANGLQASDPLKMREETTHEEDGKCETDMDGMKDEKVRNDHETKSMSDQINESNITPNISNIENVGVSEKPGSSFQESTTTNTIINESMYDAVTSVVDKRQESMFLSGRRICHTPTYSIASDLQVEVSEIGSLASTVDENVETNSSTDRDSIIYDGDVDRDVSSGSEDLWGTSFHGVKEAQETRSEDDNAQVNMSKGVVSPIALRPIDEENAADVSSCNMSPDLPDDTPTYAINNFHNIFDHMKHSMEETEAPQSSNSSNVLDQLPNETLLKRPEEWCNMPENVIDEAQVINGVNSSEATDQDNIENSRNSEDNPETSVARQESIDEASIYSVSSSPRSVLPEKTIADDVSPSAFDQHMHIGAQQSLLESMAQETLNTESPPATIPQTIQPFMDHTIDDSHDVDFNHSQEQTNSLENSNEESNVFGNMNDDELCMKEENDKNNEDYSSQVNRQEATTESMRTVNEIITSEDADEKSSEVNDKVSSSTEQTEDDKNEKPSSSGNIHEDLSQQKVTRPTVLSREGSFNIYDIFD